MNYEGFHSVWQEQALFLALCELTVFLSNLFQFLSWGVAHVHIGWHSTDT